MTKIEKISAREILDSRKNPTISTTIFLDNGKYYISSVPSGVSIGKSEAYELRDRDTSRHNGLGVLKAVNNINIQIDSMLSKMSIEDPSTLDQKMIELDATENKSNLGANAILSVSLGINRACADTNNLPLYKFINQYYKFSISPSLPTPIVNIINGGKHGNNNLDFQEFWVVPETYLSFRENIKICSEVFQNLGKTLKENNYEINKSSEGAYSPNLKNTEDAFIFILKSINESKYRDKIYLGFDAGATNFFNSNSRKYNIILDKKLLSSTELINYYLDLLNKFPIKYFEDPFAEEEWSSWKEFYNILKKVQGDAMLIGDDLFTTNKNRLQKGIDLNCANALLIKPNQIGTVSETIDCIKLAQSNNFSYIISERSGETMDDFISDLAVGTSAPYIKIGSMSRGERMAKYNRLLEIEKELL